MERVRATTVGIAEALLQHNYDMHDVGFLSGRSGISFFLCLFGHCTSEDIYFNRGIEIIEGIHEDLLSNNDHSSVFSGGISGYTWMIEYLNQNNILEVDTTALFEDIDYYLYNSMIQLLRRGNFDFLHGAGGIILYFVRRLKNMQSSRHKMVYYLNAAVDLLFQHSISQGGYTKWQTSFIYGAKKPISSIGLSHGISSIVVLLCKLIDEEIQTQKCYELLRGSVKYIVSNSRDPQIYGSYFPTHSLEVQTDHGPSRLGWCYGDLGVVNSLKLASKFINIELLDKFIVDAGQHLTTRRDLLANKIEDACLCHGTSGLTLVAYQDYLNNSNNDNFAYFSYWLDKTLDMKNYNSGVGGYLYRDHREAEGGIWANRYNFLEGAAGIGTVLLSITHQKELSMNWTESLLLC